MKGINTKFIILLVSIISLASCSKTLDINTDPNTATSVSPDLLFNYAVTSWAAKRQDGDGYIPFALMIQNQASGGNSGWGKSNVYDVNPFSIRNVWRAYYVNAGKNLKLAIKQAEEKAPYNHNAAAQCKIILAGMMYECTTIWGDVPFSEAWRSDIAYPKFDSQKDVFEELIGLLDEAVAEIDNNSPLKISDYDILYHGDLEKWEKLAQSLKFKILITMVDKDPAKASQIGTMLEEGNMIEDGAYDALYPFLNVTGKENPKYRLLSAYTGGYNFFFYCNNNVYKYMLPYADPRIPVYFSKADGATDYTPVETEEDAGLSTSVINVATLFKPDAPYIIFTSQEQLFYEAECYVRGLGVAVNLTKANELYRNAVTQALQFYGVGESDINTYLSTIPSLTSSLDPLKEIHLQQWIDLQDRPLEAFTQWRRSGTEGNEFPPLVQPSGTPAGGFMRRWDYPQSSEIIPNVNAPKDNPSYTQKLWFDL